MVPIVTICVLLVKGDVALCFFHTKNLMILVGIKDANSKSYFNKLIKLTKINTYAVAQSILLAQNTLTKRAKSGSFPF